MNPYAQPRVFAKTVLRAAIAGLLLAFSCFRPPLSLADTPVSLQIAFDNPQVDISRSGTRFLELLVQTASPPDREAQLQALPLNIALVIDRSGSMASNRKLDLVKAAAKEMVWRLQPGDQFSLIAYDDRVQVLMPSSADLDPRRVEELIDGITPGGSTNLGGGLAEGYRQVRAGVRPNAVNKVLLLSDGLANIGITDPRQLTAMAEHQAQERVSLSTFGVGLDFNEDLMADLSERGRGMYYFIDDPRHVETMLTKEFNATRQLAARDVRLTLHWQAGVRVAEVFANSFQQYDDELVIQAGDIPVGERRRIQIRFEAPSLPEGMRSIGTLRMNYRIPGVEREEHQDMPIQLAYVSPGTAIEEGRNREVSERSRIFEAQYTRARATEAVERGDVVLARRTLADSLSSLRALSTSNHKLLREIEQTKALLESLDRQLSRDERVRERKAVKYRKYLLEGC
ncbi:MAG: VWA domain-containing protein [Desulfobulbus sp.]|jgi:Ca-activated chloride channel family protein|nr:VWA domain-containing protein [Desulfobulbus sp.]